MSCREAERYIYLGKDFNNSDKFRVAFEKHLQTCTECSRKYKEVLEYSALVSRIRDIDYSAELHDSLTQDVIESINPLQVKLRRTTKELFWNVFYMPAVRLAAASILLLISLFFFSEEFTAVRSIHSLEYKFGIQADKEITRTNFASTQEIINSASSLYDFLNGNKKVLELPGEWMLIKKSELINLLEEYVKHPEDLTEPNRKKYLINLLGEEKYWALVNDREKLIKIIGR